LLRWDHPSHGPVIPTTFIPLAEQTGLITAMGRWVLEEACKDRHRWRGPGQRDDLMMSVNVSAHQLMAPDFTATVGSVLSDTGTDPALVTLEMTESVFVQDTERALLVLSDLKDLGVKLALDDFGTGYSSLSYLKQFPIDAVKIDQGFVADLELDRASYFIVFAIIELAHLLSMTVVAEGVETVQQHQRLAALGCDYCQGHYFARAMSADDLQALMQEPVDGHTTRLPLQVSAARSLRSLA
jgi:EAL domain-containing protein (putative c-di-GMP-specific phosphodiesterase class I)